MKLKILLLLFIISISEIGFSQEDFLEIDEHIYVSTINGDKTKIAVATKREIHIISTSDLQILQEINFLKKEKNVEIYDIKFQNEGKELLISTFFKKSESPSRSEKFEYLQDEKFIYSLEKKRVLNTFNGNYYQDYMNSAISISGYNELSKKLLSGNMLRLHKNGDMSIEGELLDEQKKEEWAGLFNSRSTSDKSMVFNEISGDSVITNGQIRALKAISEKRIAVLFIDSVNEAGNHYRIETRGLPELEKLNEKSFVSEGIVDRMSISKSGAFLAISGTELPDPFIGDPNKLAPRYDKFLTTNFHRIFDSKTLQEHPKISEYVVIPDILDNSGFWKIYNGDITFNSYDSGKTRLVISNYDFPFLRIRNFYKLSPDELLIVGSGSLDKENKDEFKNGIIRYSIKNNTINNMVAWSADTLEIFNPSKPVLQTNQFNFDNFQITKGNSRLLTYGDNSFEIWDVADKRRLINKKLENVISSTISNDGNYLLLFLNQFNNTHSFVIGKLNLNTGKLIKKEVSKSDTDFTPYSSLIIPSGPNGFKVLKRDGIWTVNMEDLSLQNSVDEIISEETTSPTFKLLANDGEEILVATYDIEYTESRTKETSLENVWKYNLQENRLVKLDLPSETENAFPFSAKKILLYQGKRKYSVLSIENEVIHPVSSLKLQEKIKDVVYNDNRSLVLYDVIDEYGNISKTQIQEIDNITERNIQEYKLDVEMGTSLKYFNEQFVYTSKNSLYSFYPNENGIFQWNTMPKLKRIGDISIANSNLLIDDFSLINLQDLSVGSIKNIIKDKSSYELLVGTLLEGDRILYAEDYFDFVKFRIKTLDDFKEIWVSEKIYTEDQLDFIKVSKDGKYAVVGKKFEPKKLFVIDIIKSNVIEVKMPYEAEYIIPGKVKFFDNDLYLFHHDLSFDSNKEDELANHVFNITEKRFYKKIENYEVVTKLENDQFVFYKWDVEDNAIELGQLNGEIPTINQRLKTFGAPNHFFEDKERNYFIADYGGLLFFWNKDSKSPVKTIDVGDIRKLIRKGDQLFALLWDNEIVLINLASQEVDLRTFVFDVGNNSELASITSDGEFMASTSIINNFHFVKDLKTYPLSNYEILLNRPDKVLDKLGYADNDLIGAYNKAYLKRLSRTGVNEKNISIFSENKPRITLQNKLELPRVSSTGTIKLNLEFEDVENDLEKFKIFINGIPIMEKKIKGQKLEIQETLILNAGLNQIKIKAVNVKGVASDPISFKVIREAEPDTKIHYFGIGVSKYKDETMNLKYADVDIRSISEYLSEKFTDRVTIDTLLNENVNSANIKILKEKIKNTDIDDIVILSFSGHGLVDENSNFYFATHNIDFENPKENGFSYQEIEELLSDIPARRKLILIDACNSGEIDSEEELELVDLDNENVKQYVAKGSKVVKSKNSSGLQTSFQLMKSLFRDTEEGNGAFVISAAGGREFAYESERWNNGVFTYSFIKGMEELGSKYNDQDGIILVSELQNYIYNSVIRLTDGQQKPTTRSENVEWNWELN
ncbi:caspase family protein [Salinimicrobium soli]|uniref:caspase family protein n=3 Tax=Bacteria TaxID=2 RepID=UPI003AB069BD